MSDKSVNAYRVLGLMSGTSLDGVDIALCRFVKKSGRWTWTIEASRTIGYSKTWRETLSAAPLLSGERLAELHTQYGRWLGERCKSFLRTAGKRAPDFIASHGHTIFHQPGKGFTFQLGDGAAIHATSGLPVIHDFRQLDVQLGGQGAPLVPVGDRHLFGSYDVCVNLGGISNLSFEKAGKRVAWDICFTNMGLNMLASEAGQPHDEGGQGARSGEVDGGLLDELMRLSRSTGRKRPSLGREDFERDYAVLLRDKTKPLNDRLRTMTAFISKKVCEAVTRSGGRKVLLTGGGAHNTFLVECMREQAGRRFALTVADRMTVDFKEALIFAFLGVLRFRGEANALKSVTGAIRDNCSGSMTGFGGSGRS